MKWIPEDDAGFTPNEITEVLAKIKAGPYTIFVGPWAGSLASDALEHYGDKSGRGKLVYCVYNFGRYFSADRLPDRIARAGHRLVQEVQQGQRNLF